MTRPCWTGRTGGAWGGTANPALPPAACQAPDPVGYTRQWRGPRVSVGKLYTEVGTLPPCCYPDQAEMSARSPRDQQTAILGGVGEP